ncbi:M28 family peptidase [Roseivirga sp. BDSF3-8]|uniref:M28 family peptidase n=1 Tax=Roseivirga sp. BDSF3-8 TaxID=3241598 RepID=UPI0035321477
MTSFSIRRSALFFTLLLSSCLAWGQSSRHQVKDSVILKKIYEEALAHGEAYDNLRSLTKGIGHRLSGSPQAAAAVEWGRQLMEDYGFDTVYLQPVMVPHWVRGGEDKARIVGSSKVGDMDVDVIALGNTVGTGQGGITAPLVEVQDFEELKKLGKKTVEGKIVFFNRPMDPKHVTTFTAYSGAVDQRGSGPAEAAKLGAVGVVVRSMHVGHDDVPHTGSTRYQDEVKPIPAVAISTEDADLLSSLMQNDEKVSFHMETHGRMMGEKLSYNVIGEIRGTEKPQEIIVVSGHLDSWDVGEGAHDDGAGVVHAVEVLRIMKKLDIQPKHTIRAVMYMNEENGLRGGREYARVAKEKGEVHIAAMESDSGGFTPLGFSIDGSPRHVVKMQSWADLFIPYQVFLFVPGYGGADIGPLKEQGVPLIGYRPDSQRYFDYHHTAADVFEAVDDRELHKGAATMTAMIYLIDKYGL